MARPLRLEFAGALYHVTSRGDRREAIYEDDGDRKGFLDLLGDVCGECNWTCHAYCLMTNHYHLLVETPDANLARGMRQLNGIYTQRFNGRHRRVGHVFQGRYKAILVDGNAYLLELARYIVLNPVRAGMVRAAQEWPWSSYRAMVDGMACPGWLHRDWLLAAFARRKGQAIAAYTRFVADGVGQAAPWDELRNQIFLGDDHFVQAMQERIDRDKALAEIPRTQRRPPAKPLSYYAANFNRDAAICAAYTSGGYTLRQIGEHFGLHYSRVSRIVKKSKGKT